MAADDSSHMKKVGFYPGQKPGRTEFNDLQQGAYDAFRRVQGRFLSHSARPMTPVSYSLGSGAFTASLLDNAGIDNTGLAVDWESTTLVDCSASDSGSYVGSTAPSASNKRYIVIAAAHTEEETNLKTGKGGVFAYDIDSTTVFKVYATTSSYATADDWFDNAGLKATFAEAVAAGHVPVLILERWDGTTEFAATHAHQCDGIYEVGPETDRDVLFDFLSRAMSSFVSGSISLVANAVSGQPGSVTVTGSGADAYFGVDALGDGTFRRARPIKVALPDDTVVFDGYAQHILRAKINHETEEVSYYFGTMSTSPSAAGPAIYPGNGLGVQGFYQGSQSDTNLGFLPTLDDLPIAIVTCSTPGVAPSVTAVYPDTPFAALDAMLTSTSYRPSLTMRNLRVDDTVYAANVDATGGVTVAGALTNDMVPIAAGMLTRIGGVWDWIDSGNGYSGAFEGTVTTNSDTTMLLDLELTLAYDLVDQNRAMIMCEYSPVSNTQAAALMGVPFRWIGTDGGGNADTVHIEQNWSSLGSANADRIMVVVYAIN